MHLSPVPPVGPVGPLGPGPRGPGVRADGAGPADPDHARETAGTGRTARAFLGIAAVLCAAGILAGEARYRGYETSLGARAVRALLGYPVDSERGMQTLFFGYHFHGKPGLLGLQVTLGCSSVLLMTPILLVTAGLLVFGRLPAVRIVTAAVAAGALVLGFNVLRLVVITALVGRWGPQTGFGWGHTLFGSVLTLVGMSGALAVYWFVGSTRFRPGRRGAPPAEEGAAADGSA